MKIAKKALSAFAIALISVGVMSPAAQAQAERIVAPEEQDAYVQEFYQDGGVTPVVDGSGGLTDAEIEAFHQAVRDAQQAGPLNEEIIAGEMLSDRIVLPPQVDKTTADEAEVAVAKQQAQPQMLASRAATCQRFIFTSYDVCGAILQRYNQLGNLLSFLLDPIGPQIQNPDGVGFHQQFRNGFIFWHPDTGAHAIATRNAEVFARNGWSAGWMGYPLGGEVPVTGSNPIDGELNGWVQLFQGGRIYRSPVLEGFQVASINGLILDRWLELGGPNSELGFPIADEAVASDGVGKFSVFQHGTIYWHPDTGAHPISGINLLLWQSAGSEASEYGYPIEAPSLDEFGRYIQNFQHKSLDLIEATQSTDTQFFNGKEVNSQMMYLLEDIASRYGIDIGSSSSSEISSPLALRNTVYPHPATPYPGGIPIPGDYKFYGPNSGDALHDFCTKSPDELPAAGINASFHGSCARHDICYDNAQYIKTGGYYGRTLQGVSVYKDQAAAYRGCDSQFRKNLVTVCKNVYSVVNPNREFCLGTSDVYYGFVVAAHTGHYLASEWGYTRSAPSVFNEESIDSLGRDDVADNEIPLVEPSLRV